MGSLPPSRPLIYLVTDRRKLGPAWGGDPDDRVVRQVAAAAEAGVDLIQVRERDLDGRALLGLVARCVAAVGSAPTRILVNDRLDVALAAGAAGVHLRGDSCPPARVRDICPPGFLVGRSVHDVSELPAARGADFLVAGPVFPTASKPPGYPPGGIPRLEACIAAAGVPVLAIGGLTVERTSSIAGAGAAGVAGIGLFATAGPDENNEGLGRLVHAIRRQYS